MTTFIIGFILGATAWALGLLFVYATTKLMNKTRNKKRLSDK